MIIRLGTLTALTVAAALLSGCEVNVTGNYPTYEYHEAFGYSRSSVGIDAISVANINGTITVTGQEGINELQVAGFRVGQAGSDEASKSCVADIRIDTLTSSGEFAVMTTQPNSSNGITYRVDYDVTVPNASKVKVANVNGTITIVDISGGVTLTLTNGTFTARGINGNLTASLVNGDIDSQVTLADSGECVLKVINGDVLLAVPASTSASVSVSAVNGSVLVSNLTISISSSTRTHISGTLGSGRGTINLSTVNGTARLTKM